MTAFDYGMMRDTTLELLTEFGTKATLTRVDAGDPNDWQSSGACAKQRKLPRLDEKPLERREVIMIENRNEFLSKILLNLF